MNFLVHELFYGGVGFLSPLNQSIDFKGGPKHFATSATRTNRRAVELRSHITQSIHSIDAFYTYIIYYTYWLLVKVNRSVVVVADDALPLQLNVM